MDNTNILHSRQVRDSARELQGTVKSPWADRWSWSMAALARP